MKILLITLAMALSLSRAVAQLNSGFRPEEAKELIAICNSYTYLNLEGNDSEIVPNGYNRIYDSPVYGMDNKFQIYAKGKTGVINFRGSTDKKSSWLENFYSSMIPVEGEVIIGGRKFDYKLGKDTSSGLHSGYLLGLAYLHEDLIRQVKNLNKKGIYNIYITGHSQGGALAILTRSYFHYLPVSKMSRKNKFKVYAFAQPMVGNREFIAEYDRLFSNKEMSYAMINSADAVPKMPLSYNDSTLVRDGIIALISKDKVVDKSQFIKDGLISMFQTKLTGTVSKFGKSVAKQIEKELGEVKLPEPINDINYSQVGNLMHLPPPVYPLIMKDSTLLNNPDFMAAHKRDTNGVFEDKGVYKKTSMSLNHKPYNYYTSILKVYFPNEYRKVEPKVFPLNTK
ncbi:MAG: lipase family protein [Crocinitomicaceae bacterium]|nr:lipase family protein [Crocinitomicaceae bacterium]